MNSNDFENIFEYSNPKRFSSEIQKDSFLNKNGFPGKLLTYSIENQISDIVNDIDLSKKNLILPLLEKLGISDTKDFVDIDEILRPYVFKKLDFKKISHEEFERLAYDLGIKNIENNNLENLVNVRGKISFKEFLLKELIKTNSDNEYHDVLVIYFGNSHLFSATSNLIYTIQTKVYTISELYSARKLIKLKPEHKNCIGFAETHLFEKYPAANIWNKFWLRFHK